MKISLDIKGRPDVSAEQRTSSELAKLVRKLRWIGMEEEAKQMQIVLLRVDSAATILANTHDTDLARRNDIRPNAASMRCCGEPKTM